MVIIQDVRKILNKKGARFIIIYLCIINRINSFTYASCLISGNQEELISKKHVTPLEAPNEPKAKRKLDLGGGGGGDVSPPGEMTAGIQELCTSNYQPQQDRTHEPPR